MSDLVQGLIKPKFQSAAFWGKYIDLNEEDLEPSALFRLQLQHMKAAEGTSNKKYNTANNFIFNSTNELHSDRENTLENEAASKAYSRFIELINAGLWSSNINPIRTSKGSDNYIKEKNEKIDNIIKEITQILSQLKINKPLSEEIIEKLENRLQHMGGGKIAKQYTEMKALWAEQVATEIFNNTPGLRAINSGAIEDAMNQQLIEDILVASEKDLKVPFIGGQLSVKMIAKDTKVSSSHNVGNLEDFFNLVQKANNNYRIIISDELYDALIEGSSLAGQVKSGQDQPILTTAKRNAMSLAEAGFSDHQLWQLYSESPSPWFKSTSEQNSETLEALTNYYLSKAIAKSALSKNQLYFTKDGFTTASQWMETNNYMLKFNPGLNKMGPGFISKMNPYHFYKV